MKEGVMFVDVWDHFNADRSLYGKDGLHLSSVGKARLGRVLDEGIRKEIERNSIEVQGSQRSETDISQVRSGGEENDGVRIVSEVRQGRKSVATSTSDLNA
jgi:hypothetical protein